MKQIVTRFRWTPRGLVAVGVALLLLGLQAAAAYATTPGLGDRPGGGGC